MSGIHFDVRTQDGHYLLSEYKAAQQDCSDNAVTNHGESGREKVFGICEDPYLLQRCSVIYRYSYPVMTDPPMYSWRRAMKSLERLLEWSGNRKDIVCLGRGSGVAFRTSFGESSGPLLPAKGKHLAYSPGTA